MSIGIPRPICQLAVVDIQIADWWITAARFGAGKNSTKQSAAKNRKGPGFPDPFLKSLVVALHDLHSPFTCTLVSTSLTLSIW